MDTQEASISWGALAWEGPRSVLIPRAESGFGFTLRHFVVYPPQAVLDDSRSECDQGSEVNIEPQDTIFVKSVKEGSPAQAAGLQTGDRIIAVNGNSISGKSYTDVIAAIQNSSPPLKLLVVPKDEDILQMAYQSLSREPESPRSHGAPGDTQPRVLNSPRQHRHSWDDLLQDRGQPQPSQGAYSGAVSEGPARYEVRHSYPLSQWDSSPTSDRRLVESRVEGQSQYRREAPRLSYCRESQQQSNMSSYGNPSKTKYSFGLYFPPKAAGSSVASGRTVSAESLGKSVDTSSIMPKSSTFDSSSQHRSGSRKTSLDDSSALTSSARSRDYFIRYSSDRAASDFRNRYNNRQPAYKSQHQQPTYVISRSQTVSSMAPNKYSSSSGVGATARHSTDLDSARSRYIPILSESKQTGGSSDSINVQMGIRKSSGYFDMPEPAAFNSQRFVVRIPYDRPQIQPGGSSSVPRCDEDRNGPVRQQYGTSFALTRSPNTTHIEIQKSIGKPIVSQRKNQFETGKNENTPPPPSKGGYNRYKTEIERIRTQPKFSSIAMRRASFEQSPEKEPSCVDESLRSREQTPSDYGKVLADTAQPTVKVRKISSEAYSSGSSSPHHQGPPMEAHTEQAPIRIYVSPGSSHEPGSPLLEIVPVFPVVDAAQRNSYGETGGGPGGSPRGVFHSPSASSCSGSSAASGVGGAGGDGPGAMSDSGVWVKSCHSSSDMLDGGGGSSGTPLLQEDMGSSKPSRKTSYLSAVNAPQPRVSTENPTAVESRAGYLLTPQQAIAKSQSLPYTSGQATSILQPAPSLCPQVTSGQGSEGGGVYKSSPQGSSHSLSSLPVASVLPTVMSSSDSVVLRGQHVAPDSGFSNEAVTMRKKIPESLEDQASKLHRRTSYLMATARDRANTVPIEQAFSPPQPIQEYAPGEQSGPTRQSSSAKLNKFFGETIPETMELRPADSEETSEIIRKGNLSCKISVLEGKKCSDRSWKPVYAILRQHELHLTRDKENPTSSSLEDHHIPLRASLVECAREYAKKKKHVFRVTSHQECEYLFQTEDKGTMLCWIQAIKSINEPDKAGQMDVMIAQEQAKHAPVEVFPHKMSPQLGSTSHKAARKLSALSLKAKLATSPSMRRKKSNVGEKEEHLKKGWIDRIPMMKSLKRSGDEAPVEPETSGSLQFGVPMEDCFPSPNNENIPLIVELCTSIVEARGLEVIGVYRVPGNSAAINALRHEFDSGIENVNIHNEKLLDINVISSLLKSFFRKLPEPLIPTTHYDDFIQANRNPDEIKRKLKLKRLLSMLPIHHNETFKHMAEHLNKVASYGNINKMDAKNLALMFGPTLVKKKGDDTASLVSDMSDQCRIVESIILHHDWFFSAWDQDSTIPTETRVETVALNENHSVKDDDEEAESAISTKEIISSIVSAASKKLKGQTDKSMDSLDMVDTSSTTSVSVELKERSSDDSTLISSYTKSISSFTSSRSASEEFLLSKSSTPTNLALHGSAPIASSESDFMDLEYADASSHPQHHYSRESLVDKDDELISHGLPTHAIHHRLKRINNDVNVVSALLQSIEQEHLKERERWRREQEVLEREQRKTQLELEQEEQQDSLDNLLAWQGATPMPDLVSSSYVGEYDNVRMLEQGYVLRPSDRRSIKLPNVTVSPTGSQEESITQTRSQIQEAMRSSGVPLGPANLLCVPSRPSSMRHSLTRRHHGSLDSLIDLLDKQQEKRASWASSDSEDGSDLLTSITTTFDQKLQILLNPKYKLTGAKRAKDSVSGQRVDSDSHRLSRAVQQSYTTSALVDADDSYKDPSLHRSFKSDPKIGIASRFERVSENPRASSSSPITVGISSDSLQKKSYLPDFKAFLGKGQPQPKELNSVVLTQPKKLDPGKVVSRYGIKSSSRPISKSEKTERNCSLVRRSREESSLLGQINATGTEKCNNGRQSHSRGGHRRHTVGGTEDLEHNSALALICRGQHYEQDRQDLRRSAWEQLQPAVKDPSRGMQDWIQRERLRGSTPDLTEN